MEKVLVAGANGTTGKKIVQILKSSTDFKPMAMIRQKDQIKYFQDQGIETVFADLEEDVSQTPKDMDRVIFAAGSGGKNVEGVDENGAKKLIDASKDFGVKKFVMLSSMGADQPEKADQLKDYLKAKHNADEHLKQSGLNYSIVRPGALNNYEGEGKIQLSTHLDKSGEIPREDVAETLVASLYDSVAQNKVFEILEGQEPIKEALKNA